EIRLKKLEERLRKSAKKTKELKHETDRLVREGKKGKSEHLKVLEKLNRAVLEERAAASILEQHKENPQTQSKQDYYSYNDIDKYIHYIKSNLNQADAYEVFEWVVGEGILFGEKVSLIGGALYLKNPIDEDYIRLTSDFKPSSYSAPLAVLKIIDNREYDDYLAYKRRLSLSRHISPGTNFLYLNNFIE